MASADNLVKAVLSGSLSAVQRHLKKGADVNRMALAGTPLYAAATEGALEIARVLLAAGADVNIGAVDTPLQRAIQRRHFELASLFVEAKADVNRAPSPNVPPALALAAAARNAELVRALLAAGARHAVRSNVRLELGGEFVLHENVTALHVAAYLGDAATAAVLVAAGASSSIKDGRERTVLDVVHSGDDAAMKAMKALFESS